MQYFKTYSSNTLAGAGNQSFFHTENANRIYTGRVYFKVFAGGSFNYSFLYSNTVDSTFSDGSTSHANLVCDEWDIVALKATVTKSCNPNDTDITNLQDLTFNGNKSKTVAPGEFFSTDPCPLNANTDDYVCLEISYIGRQIPNHNESLVAMFLKENGVWVKSVKCPVPSMMGCDRKVKARIGFLGDSITQGIGSTFNSYNHYAAKTAELVGTDYSYWDIGLGYARARDAATGGAWMFKASKVDLAVVCLGVNDLVSVDRATESQIITYLDNVIKFLKESGVKILLQTIPPFGYKDERKMVWENANKYIKTVLSCEVDGVFDNSFLGKEGDKANAIYGGHPNDEGCKVWAEHLAPVLTELTDKFSN